MIEADNKRPSLLTSGLANWLSMAVNLLVSLVTVPLMIHHLGKQDYGIWIVANSFLGYYGLLRMGVDTSIMRFLPYHIGRQDRRAATEVVNTALGMFAFVGLVILLLSMVAAGPIARFYGGGRQLALLVLLMGVAGALECPYRVFDAALRAEEKWVSANLIASVTAVARGAAIVLCIWLGYRLVEMGGATIGVVLVTLVVATLAFTRVSNGIRLGYSMFSSARVPEMVSFGVLTTVTTLAYSLVFQGHGLIIGKLISLEAVGIYAVASPLAARLRQAIWAPFQVTWPRFALLHGEEDFDGLARLFAKASRYCSQLSAFLVLLAILFGPPFIRVWVGRGFEMAERALVILCIGVLVEGSFFAINAFLGGTGRQRVQAMLALIEGTLGLTLSLLLGWRNGMLGVAWGYTISVIVVRGIVSTLCVCEILRINPIRYLYRSCMAPWVFSGALVCLGYALRMPSRIQNWSSLIAVLVPGIAAAGIGMYVFVMRGQERERITGWMRRSLPLWS